MSDSLSAIVNGGWSWLRDASWQIAVLVVVIAALTSLLSNHSARLRHSLWMLVIVKVFVPPWVYGLVNYGPGNWLNLDSSLRLLSSEGDPRSVERYATLATLGTTDVDSGNVATGPLIALIVWLAGAIICLSTSLFHYVRLRGTVRKLQVVDEGPMRVAMERAAMELGLNHCPELRLSERGSNPFLIGVFRPIIVLPEQLQATAGEAQIETVLTHELAHFRRGDNAIGWLQLVAVSLYWFHPGVWWAMKMIRQCREEACDETVLSRTSLTPESYGDAMLAIATSTRTGQVVEPGLVGVCQRGTQFQNRLEKIMTFSEKRRTFGWGWKMFVVVSGLLLLPMSPRPSSGLQAQERATDATTKTMPSKQPVVVSSQPEVGATNVSVATNEIRVTFDRDMSQGMSWTGGPPFFPLLRDDAKARWINQRTCVLPVKLERGKFYRVGINAKSFTNFRSVDGEAAQQVAIYFATEGASPEVIALAQKPEIVQLSPSNGADDVDPNLQTLSVTFNMAMGPGMSWAGGGPEFPELPDGLKPTWSEDQRTCTMPVKLQPNKLYRMGLNTPRFKNFQSAAGVPSEPVEYSFKTR